MLPIPLLNQFVCFAVMGEYGEGSHFQLRRWIYIFACFNYYVVFFGIWTFGCLLLHYFQNDFLKFFVRIFSIFTYISYILVAAFNLRCKCVYDFLLINLNKYWIFEI